MKPRAEKIRAMSAKAARPYKAKLYMVTVLSRPSIFEKIRLIDASFVKSNYNGFYAINKECHLSSVGRAAHS